MLDARRYLYVLFCCQQAIEKALKAVIVKRTSEFPPRIHNLVKLAEIAGVTMDSHKTELLEDLSTFYIESRYPDEKAELAEQASSKKAKETMRDTEDVVECLFSMLK